MHLPFWPTRKVRDGMDPIQDAADRLAPMAQEKAKERVKQTVKARRAIGTELTILSTRPGPTACDIQSSHPGR
jgi:hypothetical protein